MNWSCRRTDDGEQKTEDGEQKTDDGEQKTEDRERKTELFGFGIGPTPRREAGIKVC